MKTFYSDAHLAHNPPEEFEGGRLNPAVEIPERAERVREAVESRDLGSICEPAEFGDEPILRVHDADMVTFLGEAHDHWIQKYGANAPAAIPSAWPSRGHRQQRTGHIESRLGTFAFDTATPIVKGTWTAAKTGVNVALSAAQAVRSGDRSAFALTRPPGHHASADVFGGYCYLNNVAIAAQWLADQGMKPAILDVDYHHGNGTQAMFYDRPDVFFASIHADPSFAYPHFLGFADEKGEGAGEGANLNIPLPEGTDWARYQEAMFHALGAVKDFAPDVLLVSLGLDTFGGDPISRFDLKHNDYFRMGAILEDAKLPTVFVFEGGYNVEALGSITANVLDGFQNT
ncbi:MAG TPA: histone deacetylase family protein [Rhizomicrobium sp.]|nr:histone deacetylase family protein [Rhizomicrobium sp.]